MTTLAEAGVEIVAETADFDQSLRRQIEGAAGAADRASQTVGRRVGQTITNTASRALRGLSSIMSAALNPRVALAGLHKGLSSITSLADRVASRFSATGARIARAFTPGIQALGRFRDGFQSTQVAASRFSGVMGSLGGVARSTMNAFTAMGSRLGSVFAPGIQALGRFRDGFQSTQVAASRFSGVMGSLGGVARKVTNSIGSTLDGLRGRLRETWKEAQKGEGVFSGLGEVVQGVFAGFAGFALAETALAAVDEFFRGSVQAFGDFEAGMQAAFTLLPGISRQAMGEMTEQVKAFAKEANTIPEEVVPALYSALGAGVPQDTVFDFLETANKAAIAGVTDLQTSVDALTSVVNTYGSDVISAGEVSDQVFTLMRLGKTTFDEVAASVANVAPVASDFGVAFGDVAASMATLTALGTPTSESTTQIRAAISELGQSGTEASKVFEKTAGTTFPKFIREGGNFEEALQVMSKAADESGKSVLDLFGSIEAGSAVASLTGRAGSKVFAKAMEEMAGSAGATETAFETMNQGVNISMKRLQVAVSSAAIELGERLSGVAVGAVDVAASVIDRFPDMLDRIGSALSDSGAADALQGMFSGLSDVVDGLRPMLSGFVTALGYIGSAAANLLGYLEPLGGVLSRLGDFLSNNAAAVRLLGTVLGGLVTGLAVYRTAAFAATLASRALSLGIRGISTAIRGIPLIGWALAAVGALIALYQSSEKFREIVDNAFSAVRGAVQSAWDYIEPVWNTMVERLSALWDAVSGWEGWQVAWEFIQNAVSSAWDVISGIWDSITGAWDNLTSSTGETSWWTSTWETLSGAVETTWGVLSTVFEQISEAWELLSSLVSGDLEFSDIGSFIADSFGRLAEVGTGIGEFLVEKLQELPGKAIGAIKEFGPVVADFLIGQIEAIPGRIGSAFSLISGAVSEWVSSIPDRISDAIGAGEGMWEWIKDGVGTAVEYLKGVGENIVEYMKGIPDTIKSSIDAGAIVEWLKDVPNRIKEFMSDYGMNILRGFAIAIGVVVLGVPALLLGLLAAIVVVLGTIAWELIKWAWSAFTNMMTEAGRAVMSGLDKIVQWFVSLPEMVMSGLVNFGARLASWATNSLAAMRSALSSGMNAVRTWWSNTWNNVFALARGAWNTFQTWVVGAAGRIRDRVMEPINTLKDRMVGAFDSAKTGIENAWDDVRSVVGKPIEWVVNTAYDSWLRGVWNKVVEKFGGTTLPSYTVAFAKGGVFPGYTPGRDVHAMPMAAFSGGESVLRPEVTRAWGEKTTHMLNKLARSGGVSAVRKALMMLFSGQNPFTGMSVPRVSPASGGVFAARFSTGGVLGRVTGAASGFASWLSDTASDFSDAMMDFLDDPGGMLRKLFDSVMDYSKMPEWGTGWTDLLKRVPEKIIKELIEKAKSLFSFDGDWMNVGGDVGGRLGAALGFARSQAGKPYIWGGVGPRGYDCSGFMSAIHNIILGKRPYSRRYTTHSFKGNSFGGFRRNMPSPFTVGVTHAGVGHMSGTLLKTNVESRGSAGVVVGSRARGTTNALYTHRYGLTGAGRARPNSSMGGEGIMYDSGGWLRPGISLVGNFTGRPESIRTYAQEKNVSELVRLLQRRVPLRASLVPDDRRSDFVSVMRRAGVDVGGGTTVNAPVTVTTYAADPETVAYKTAARIARLVG